MCTVYVNARWSSGVKRRIMIEWVRKWIIYHIVSVKTKFDKNLRTITKSQHVFHLHSREIKIQYLLFCDITYC